MTLPGLSLAYDAIPGLADVADRALRGVADVHVTAIPEVRPVLAARIAREIPRDRLLLVVTATAREA